MTISSGATAPALKPALFFKAKQLEQAERYAKFNDTPYSLEPNCKESPGGRRDLQIDPVGGARPRVLATTGNRWQRRT